MRAGKAATALVDLPGGRGSASAFCIDRSGLFVTNEHAVAALGPVPADGKSRELSLVLNSGEADQKVVKATVLRADKEADLALLQARPAKDGDAFPALDLGDAADLFETMPVTAFGYPFGKMLADKGESPSVTVTTGRVTSLRKSKGELHLVQLDNSLNPGNSGGPVLDEKGRVVGVVQAGIRGSGVNFAIPVSRSARCSTSRW